MPPECHLEASPDLSICCLRGGVEAPPKASRADSSQEREACANPAQMPSRPEQHMI